MGNSLASVCRGNKTAKVMKIDGEIIKLKTPIKVLEVIKDYPSHVVIESSTFKRFGIRADPLDSEEYLEAGKIYFLVELPKLPETSSTGGGSVRVKVRLPKADVDKIIGQSRDDGEVSERIVELCVKKNKKKKVGDDRGVFVGL